MRVVEITHPIPVERRLRKSAHPGNRVAPPLCDSLIAGVPYDDGRVTTVHYVAT